MIKVNRRRLLIGATCAVLVLLAGGGWAATHLPGRSRSASAPAWSSPSASSVPGASANAGPGRAAAGLPPPVGWKLSDVPAFAPPPAPEPVVLPPGDQVPYLSRIPVTQPVAFLTIDDGYLKPGEAPKLFAAAHIPVTLFLTTDAIHDNVPFFDHLRSSGAVIEAHTISHPELRGKSEQFQHHQICDGADQLGKWYGRRPLVFRPPFGDKDQTTLRVTKSCGMKAAFFWKETVDKGKVRFQEGNTVKPGDIILMHFRPAFVKDFLAALHAIKKAGLTPARLEDYVPGAAAGVPPLAAPAAGATPSALGGGTSSPLRDAASTALGGATVSSLGVATSSLLGRATSLPGGATPWSPGGATVSSLGVATPSCSVVRRVT